MEFLDEQLNKVSQVTRVLPYICLSVIIWLFVITVLVTLIFFNVTDIKTVVEAMKTCII